MITNMVLLFFLAIISNIIGTLVGGGGLITLPVMILLNLPVQVGIGANKFATGLGSFGNTLFLFKKKILQLSMIVKITILGGLGGVAGALITANLSEKILNVAVIFLLSIALVLTILKPKQKTEEDAELASTKRTKFLYGAGSFLVGIYNGGFGPGAATFGILLYMQQGIAYIKSAQMTRVLIFGGNIAAFFIYLFTGYINWYYTIPLALGAIIGAQIGMLILPKVPHHIARKLLIGVTIILIIQVGIKLI